MTDFRVIYENPDLPDDTLQVLTPTPEWMEEAKSGRLPPIWVYWRLKEAESKAIEAGNHNNFEHDHDMWMQQFLAPRIGSLTEMEAIEYLIMKDIPHSVWSKKHNRPMFAIVHKDEIPKNREFRNAWRLAK